MAGRDLRALFGSNDRSLGTEEAFTNREGQWAQVAAALAEHLAHVVADGFDVQDLETARRNVLVFHGIGGVGKTTLSRKLEAALTASEHRPTQWGEPSWPQAPRLLPVRIDLARSAGTDFERLVLTLRLALAGLDRALPAFDLALGRYWEHNHPGESLEEYLRRAGLVSRFAKALPGQVQAALSKAAEELALPGAVGSAVGQVATAVVRAVRERRTTARALAGCPRLADLLEAEPDLEALSFYPHLLAYEIDRLPAKKAVVPVVLLDTFEDTGDRTNRDLERLIQRVVWLMPNALFIVTGRSRLQWADDALQGQLDYTGPAAWPQLASHIPAAREAVPIAPAGMEPATDRQVLIGDFSPEDCDDYLARRLTADGRPLIGDDLRRVITARSHGLPLYLDLAVMRFLEIRRTREPEAADFDHDFPALVSRTLQDLTPDERHVLRAVSLLDAFDIPLAAKASGMTHQAAALRLVERPFVRENQLALWPYHLHAVVRSTIRRADDHTDDRWSDQDWASAAVRAFDTLGDQWAGSTSRSRMLLVACLRQGLTLARDHRLDLGWLGGAAWAYVSDSVWEPLAPPAPAGQASTDRPPGATVLQTPADALVETLSTLAARQREHRTRTADRLTRVIDSRLLPEDLTDMALYYRAKAHRDLGRTGASRQGMQQVASGTTRLAPAARRGLAHLARLDGDFPTAHAAAQTLGWAGRQNRVLGDLAWVHAQMDQAATAYQAARTDAERHGVAGETATSQAQLGFVRAFTDPDTADDDLDLAAQLLIGLDLRATALTTRIAALVRDAGSGGDDFPDRANVLDAEVRASGVRAARTTLALAVCFHHAVLNNDDELDTAIHDLDQLTRGRDYAYYTDIAHFMADRPLQHPSPAHWLDGNQAVRDRWRALVTARQNRLRPTSHS
ncbi:ATP/GTP-binding protein [Streptomyces kaniharaensis]|uniref:ATP/GTP-binding protein n=1 Tax=Streptomyces kaniharaensis TaxID=212423 RepID=A0A6N7L1Z9_9ACTN|nr:ATP/GTP-binding protein [Streptomyces kaniharaensis]MQS17862.1 ATP/GTP-binding protein [Streptomyces kaniharaensis]